MLLLLTMRKHFKSRSGMYQLNLKELSVKELLKEFYRIRHKGSPSHEDLMKWMEVYSELSYRNIQIQE